MGYPERRLRFLIHSARLLLLDRQLKRAAIDLHWLYILAGAIFAAFALSSAGDGRIPSAGATPLSGD